MEEKKYLKWYNKVGYGSGDIAGNVVYAFLTSFVMIYLTDSSKKYLAQWLLNGLKDNSKRMILCNLRKKFGKDFLSDIDRFGQLKGGKDE